MRQIYFIMWIFLKEAPLETSVAIPERVDTDPDPTFQADADPDTKFV